MPSVGAEGANLPTRAFPFLIFPSSYDLKRLHMLVFIRHNCFQNRPILDSNPSQVGVNS
jgi:hypothetical protein